MVAQLHDMSRAALIKKCIAAKLKRAGAGWQACGFRTSSPTRGEMIAKLRDDAALEAARSAAAEEKVNQRRLRDVQEHLRAWLIAAHVNQRTFTCKELEDAIIKDHLEQYSAYASLFTGELNPYGATPETPETTKARSAEAKFRASIRSYLFEQSPSSRQYWRKGGVARHTESEDRYQAPSGYIPINRGLANKNAALGWSDQGGAVRGSHWEVVRVRAGAWDEALHGPLPTHVQRMQDGERIGWRGAQSRGARFIRAQRYWAD